MAQHVKAPTATMSHPAEWLALLRIVVGLYFVKSLVTKMSVVLLGGLLPIPAVSERWLTRSPSISTSSRESLSRTATSLPS